VVRQVHLIAVVSTFLMAVLVEGCAAGDPGNNDGRGGSRSAVCSEEETTVPEGDQSKSQTAQEPVGLEAKVVSPRDQGNLPVGFGEGSLWAIGSIRATPPSASASASASPPGAAGAAGGPGGSPKTLFVGLDPQTDEELATSGGGVAPKAVLRRMDPQTGEVVATIPLKGLNDAFTQVAFGAGSVWVSSGYYEMGPAPKRYPGDVVFRVDPQTNRVVDRIPVDPPSGLAFGHGSVWATSAGYGTVSRIDPRTGEVVAKIKVGRGALGIATDESSGAVWVASVYLPKDYGGYDFPKYSEDRNLTRIDPETNRVVEEIPIEAHSHYGGGANSVAVGEGAVWVLSGDGNLLKVDPATNEIAARVRVGDSPSHLAVYGGGVWEMVQAKEVRLVRVDPRTMHIVASEDIGPIPKIQTGALAAGGGYVWFWSEEGLARVSP
jgi:glutamine cyclotransferase